jgi:single-strand DNA-binding protein
MTSPLAIEAFVGSEPQVRKTNQGATVCSFRAAVNHRRLDNVTGQWVNNGTSWYTVTSYGPLADNVATQIRKGSAVVIIGDLKVREWEANGRTGTTAEVTASAIGPNLVFGEREINSTPAVQEPHDAAYIPAPTSLAEVNSTPTVPRVIADEEIPF